MIISQGGNRLLRKTIIVPLLVFQLFFYAPIGFATPPADELNQYLAEIGWTKQQLINYLSNYELPLAGFNSVQDLKTALGTPINAQNYQKLLAKYQLSDQELKAMMAHFGDSLNQYKFIQDLETSLGFYTNHNHLMAQIENRLAQTGITNGEAEKLFTYLNQVEENNKTQLDKMMVLDAQMEKFLSAVNSSSLTDAQINELTQLLTQAMNLYDIQVKFKMNHHNISLNNLLKLKHAPGNLYTAIYSNTGELLMDFTLPAAFFQDMMQSWNQLIHLGELSNEFVDYLHSEKYNNAQMLK